MLTSVAQDTILVVEDDADIRSLLQDVLTLEGFRVTSAGTPLEALERVQGMRPEVILMDLMLPGMSGFELAETIRRDMDVPIVAMSASSFLLQEAERWPYFDGAVPKPFDWDALLSRLQTRARCR